MRVQSGSELGLGPHGRRFWGWAQGPLLGSALLYHRRNSMCSTFNLEAYQWHLPPTSEHRKGAGVESGRGAGGGICLEEERKLGPPPGSSCCWLSD